MGGFVRGLFRPWIVTFRPMKMPASSRTMVLRSMHPVYGSMTELFRSEFFRRMYCWIEFMFVRITNRLLSATHRIQWRLRTIVITIS